MQLTNHLNYAMGDEESRIRRYIGRLEEYFSLNKHEDIVNMLGKLEEANLNPGIIMRTGVGFKVNDIRRGTANYQVKQKARSVIMKWRKVVLDAERRKEQEKLNQGREQSSERKRPRLSESSSSSDEEVEPQRLSKADELEKLRLEREKKKSMLERSSSVQADSGKSHDDDVRKDPRKVSESKILEALEDPNVKVPNIKRKYIAKAIEECLFEEFRAINKKFLAKLNSRVYNLKNNADLRRKVLEKKISARQLCHMTAEEMATDERRAQRQEMEAENLQARVVTDQEDNEVRVHCPQCRAVFLKQSETLTSNMNSCVRCGHLWREIE